MEPSGTNNPLELFNQCLYRVHRGFDEHEASGFSPFAFLFVSHAVDPVLVTLVIVFFRHSGGYSVGDPPLPIPNREVKPSGADGTARPAGE